MCVGLFPLLGITDPVMLPTLTSELEPTLTVPPELLPDQLMLPPTSRPVGTESPDAVNVPAVWLATVKLLPTVRLPPIATGPVVEVAPRAAFPWTNTPKPWLPVAGLYEAAAGAKPRAAAWASRAASGRAGVKPRPAESPSRAAGGRTGAAVAGAGATSRLAATSAPATPEASSRGTGLPGTRIAVIRR